MKTMIKRMSVIVMAFMVAANMVGCIGLDQIQARQVEQALEARYGEEFKVTRIGNRLGSGEPDTAEAYCHPVANPDIVFRARIDIDGNLLNNPYPSAVLEYQMEEYMTSNFEMEGMQVQINGYLGVTGPNSNYENVDLKAEDALTQAAGYDIEFVLRVAMVDSGDVYEMANCVYESMMKACEIKDDIAIMITLFVVSEEDFENCADALKGVDTAGDTFYESYGCKKVTVNWMNDENVIGIKKSVDEMIEEWGKI